MRNAINVCFISKTSAKKNQTPSSDPRYHYGHNDCANVEDLFVFITGRFRTASFSTDSLISSRPGTYASSLLSAIASILLIDGFEQAL